MKQNPKELSIFLICLGILGGLASLGWMFLFLQLPHMLFICDPEVMCETQQELDAEALIGGSFFLVIALVSFLSAFVSWKKVFWGGMLQLLLFLLLATASLILGHSYPSLILFGLLIPPSCLYFLGGYSAILWKLASAKTYSSLNTEATLSEIQSSSNYVIISTSLGIVGGLIAILGSDLAIVDIDIKYGVGVIIEIITGLAAIIGGILIYNRKRFGAYLQFFSIINAITALIIFNPFALIPGIMILASGWVGLVALKKNKRYLA